MVERRSVAPDVAGSIPVTHPISTTPCIGISLTNSLKRHRLLSLLALILFLLNSGTTANSAQRASTTRIQTPGGSAGSNHPSVDTRPYVVLISFDGFRPDYLDRYNTPHFDHLATIGISAKALVSIFPSLTFPAHYSIATGMHPESHGIVGNRFFDPDRGEYFNYRDRATVGDGTWWGGEPIWVTAETQGMVTAAFFFPGTEAAIKGVRPTYWRPYDGQVPNTDRIQQVLEWLSLPIKQRPHLVTLYFSLVDRDGHNIGPESAGMRQSVESADALLGQLTTGIQSLPHATQVAIVVVSDHGMAAPNTTQVSLIPEAVNLSQVRTVSVGPMMSMHTGDRDQSLRLRDQLNNSLDKAHAYLREDIPIHLHHRSNRRIGDVVVIPEGTGIVRSTRSDNLPAGMHGWDPTLTDMYGLFMASGPGLRPGTRLDQVRSIDVYPFLTTLLGLQPHGDVTGSMTTFESALAAPTRP